MYLIFGLVAIVSALAAVALITARHSDEDPLIEYHAPDVSNSALFTCRSHGADFDEFRDYARHMRGVDHGWT